VLIGSSEATECASKPLTLVLELPVPGWLLVARHRGCWVVDVAGVDVGTVGAEAGVVLPGKWEDEAVAEEQEVLEGSELV
jgi:hypothetical protein